MLFIKGFLIGIGKIIPGVSGALLAINFKVYERLIDSITHFFNNPKENIKFLLTIGLGIISAIILFSNIILYLLTNYYFITMLFFIGLIIGGLYNFSRTINYTKSNIVVIILFSLVVIITTITSNNNTYNLKNNYIDNIVFFGAGIIEVFASIVPGISGTSLLILLGIYNQVLQMISMIYNYHYVINNINIYFSYSLGMFISLIINSYLINYFIKKHRNITNCIILGLSIGSIIYLIKITISKNITILELIIGIVFLFIGLLLSSIFDKK